MRIPGWGEVNLPKITIPTASDVINLFSRGAAEAQSSHSLSPSPSSAPVEVQHDGRIFSTVASLSPSVAAIEKVSSEVIATVYHPNCSIHENVFRITAQSCPNVFANDQVLELFPSDAPDVINNITTHEISENQSNLYSDISVLAEVPAPSVAAAASVTEQIFFGPDQMQIVAQKASSNALTTVPPSLFQAMTTHVTEAVNESIQTNASLDAVEESIVINATVDVKANITASVGVSSFRMVGNVVGNVLWTMGTVCVYDLVTQAASSYVPPTVAKAAGIATQLAVLGAGAGVTYLAGKKSCDKWNDLGLPITQGMVTLVSGGATLHQVALLGAKLIR